MKRSVQRQPLRRIFAVLQLMEYHQSPSRSCGCSSNSWNTARPWISALPFCNVLSFCPDDKTIPLSSLPKCFHISHYHGIFLPHGSCSAQCHIFEWLPDMQHWYTGCHGRNAQWLFTFCIQPYSVLTGICSSSAAAFADPRFLENLTACTLYSSSYSLFFDIFVSSIFPFFYFIPLWLMCQVLLYRIIWKSRKNRKWFWRLCFGTGWMAT